MMASFPVAAKEKPLGVFGVWNAFTYEQGGQTVCYMVTTKTVKSAGPAKREGPYLMITHRPIEGSIDVFSYGAGTLLDPKRDVSLRAGKSAFDLFAARDVAWARDAQTDHKLAAAIKNAATAETKAIPAKRGKAIDDVFDLKGAAAAYNAIGKACGLPGESPKKSPPKTVPKKPAPQKPAK
jgi:hypothetical protein